MNHPYQHQPAPAPTFPNQQPVYVQNAGSDDFIDWDSVEATPEHSLIPKGDYKMSLEKINQELVKSGDNIGKPRYNCQITITDDRQTGRKIFRDFMPHSEKSRAAVKSLALATNTPTQGKNMIQILLDVMDKDFIGNVGISKGTGEFQDSNTIWSFKPLPVIQQQAPAQQMQPPRPAHIPLHAQFANGFWWVQNPNSPNGWDNLGG